jgi:hypothetical protein
MNLTPAALIEFFTKGGKYTNKKDVIIRNEGQTFYIAVGLVKGNEDGSDYMLYDKIFGADKFMEAYSIASLKDLESIERSKLWLRYFSEAAELIYTNKEGVAIHFRKFRSQTMVFSRDLKYYNEVDRFLNMTEHFIEFIDENHEEWHVISLN